LGLKHNGIDVREENIIISDIEEEVLLGIYEFENGRKLAEKFMSLKTKPTAIFSINDMTALGIMQKLIESGMKVPKDVSVIGFDNIEISSMVNPPLSTINQPSFETGRLACKMLIDSIDSSTKSSIAIKLDPSLVIRSSVSKIN
jgi:DNA-binding LacI/PurR family transcriptional regulator